METMENVEFDPRLVQATSVNAPDDGVPGQKAAQPKALKITAASSNPKMFTLPWHKPLSQWPADLLANLPRGISRHVVRFVRVGNDVYAMKEITQSVAQREYELLRQLEKIDVPSVKPIAVVTGRHDRDGKPLESMLVTQHLKFSLPYRALFARNLREDTADRLIDALAVLLVRLHLIGFYWGDVSLSNVLFLRDADCFAAVLVDAETGELYPQLTEGQREYDIDLARTNIIGELMDLSSGKLLPDDVDEVEVGNRLVERYHSLWSALTDVESFSPDEMWKIEKRVNRLNELGFDVDELEMNTSEDGNRVRVRPRVVDAGYASRKLLRLTGLDVQENQARRLLNDLDAYRTSTWRQGEDLEIVATDWMREVFEPTVRMIPAEYRSQIEPAQFFHEVLTHRWYLAEKVGHDVPMAEAVNSYIDTVLPNYKLDAKVMDAINADADAGVVDDEDSYGDDGYGSDYNPDYDPDAAVWAS
ncbi:lipopolysaccharide kinase [Bifidobacterium sp. UTCIF-39]|nr:lipopolysaccharide kinase [Bifidobacterium sp. UTCIF-39]